MTSASPSDRNQLVHPVLDAIILAGGRGSRLGGARKHRMMFEDMSLLDRAVSTAVSAASAVVVVGDDGAPSCDILSVCEFPRWGGPAAALAAGLSALPVDAATVILVLAADVPHIARAVAILIAHVEDDGTCEGWIATDEEGRAQVLLAAYRRDALARRCERLHADGLLTGASIRQLVGDLRTRPIPLPTELCRDVDTPADVARFALSIPTRLESS